MHAYFGLYGSRVMVVMTVDDYFKEQWGVMTALSELGDLQKDNGKFIPLNS